MFDAKKLLEDYFNETAVLDRKTSQIIVPPFFHPYSAESIAVKVYELPDGRPVFTDCGTTTDYYGVKEIGMKPYQKRIDAVMEYFGLKYDDGVFSMECSCKDKNHVLTALSNFIEAISVLAHIDL